MVALKEKARRGRILPAVLPDSWRDKLGQMRSILGKLRRRGGLPENQLPPGDTWSLQTGLRSLKGEYRNNNEDRCLVDTSVGLMMAVDGMGGHVGGARAAQIVARVISQVLRAERIEHATELEEIQDIVESAIQQARREMMQFSDRHPDYRSMGATVALAIVLDDQAYIANVGDCRVYHLHGEWLRQVTTDHTLVQALVDAGAVSKSEARNHPLRHVVTNYVGVKPLDAPPRVTRVQLSPGDRLLLTTDGVSGVLEDQELRDLLLEHKQPQTAADAVVAQALLKKSKDNVSCVVGNLNVVHERALDWEPSEFCTCSAVA